MIEFTPDNVVDAVIEQMSTTTDPRLRTIMASLVRHLHAFAREVELTPEEWLQGIDFLTRTGQTCTAQRQECILLSDTLGLSTLVNTLNDASRTEHGTHTSLLGPFYRDNVPHKALGESISQGDDSPPILLWGTVRNARGEPLPDARLEIWQTSSHGNYDLQEGDGSQIDFRGVFHTAADGRYHFQTVRPCSYSIPTDGPVGEMLRAQQRHGFRPAHVHFLVNAPGYRELVTALYFPDPYLESDTVFGAAADLVAEEAAADPAAPVQGLPSVRFDIVLPRADNADDGRVGADPAQIGRR